MEHRGNYTFFLNIYNLVQGDIKTEHQYTVLSSLRVQVQYAHETQVAYSVDVLLKQGKVLETFQLLHPFLSYAVCYALLVNFIHTRKQFGKIQFTLRLSTCGLFKVTNFSQLSLVDLAMELRNALIKPTK